MINEQNHFSLFGLPVSYDVDKTSLTRKYRELQKAVHPDKFSNSTEQERLLAIHKASQVNDGYEVLKSPLRRAQYLLELNDIVANDNATISDPYFLMQQMEIRESLESATKNTDPLSALDEVLDQIDAMFNKLLSEIKSKFSESEPDYVAISEVVLKLQFFNRLKSEAESQLASFEN